MMKHIFLSLFLGAVVFGFYVAYYVGAFHSVDLARESRGPHYMVYKVHRGAYHEIVSVIQEVETWAKDQGIDCSKSFGHYLDNTDLVEQPRLTSHGGCIVESLPSQLPEGFESKKINEARYLIAKFEGSPGIGPLKVYPAANDYARQNRLPLDQDVIEIYTIHSEDKMTTEYLFRIQEK